MTVKRVCAKLYSNSFENLEGKDLTFSFLPYQIKKNLAYLAVPLTKGQQQDLV